MSQNLASVAVLIGALRVKSLLVESCNGSLTVTDCNWVQTESFYIHLQTQKICAPLEINESPRPV